MANVMKELKAEICRLARKEIKRELAPVKRVVAARRRLLADLRRQALMLQKEISAMRKSVAPGRPAEPASAAPAGRFWISGKGVKTLRRRLGLTQAKLAKLAGVSVPSVVNWEKQAGTIKLRKATAAKLQQIRGLKKRQAKELLGSPAPAAGKKKKVRKSKKS